MKRYLLLVVLFAVFLAAKDFIYPAPVMEKVNIIPNNAKAPAPLIDTTLIDNPSISTAREIVVSSGFKDYSDDTIRVIAVKSAGERALYVETDTMTLGFIPNGFRRDTIYIFGSGSTAHAVATGYLSANFPDLQYKSIFAGQAASPFSFFRFQWDPFMPVPGWALRDSIPVGSGIYDIATGLISNTTYYDIFVGAASTTPSSQVLWLRWNGTGYDSSRIYLTGTQIVRGIAVGDVNPDIPGEEVYVVGGTNLWMVYWDNLSVSWNSTIITNALTSASDVAIGDIDPNLPGNEIAIVHASTSYQLSVWNYSSGIWSGRAWTLTTTWGTGDGHEIAVGDVLTENPGNEVLFTGVSATGFPYIFWLAPNGSAWARSLQEPSSGTTEYGVCIGDINRFRNGNEFAIVGGGRFVEYEQILSPIDLVTYYYILYYPTSVINREDTIYLTIFNSGTDGVAGFEYGYYLKDHSYISGSVISSEIINPNTYLTLPITITPDFLGYDTIIAYVNIAGDGNPLNDTTKMHYEVWDDSTVAASGFNSRLFPPINASSYYPTLSSSFNWTRYILSGSYNWLRTTAPINPTAPVLEGYAVAYYPSYSASSGSSARLLTHRFNVGPNARKVILDFYMYHDNGYSTNYDSIYVQFGFDTVNFTTVTGFQRYYSTNGWQKHTVEIGDFSSNTKLYIGFRAISKYGNNMFIDSVRVFTAPPTAPANDAGITAVKLPNPPYFQGGSYPVTVTIKNYGLDPITTCDVLFKWNTGGPVLETWNGYLSGGQTTDYTFIVPWTPTNAGVDTIWAWTALVGDGDPSNDTSFKEVNVCPEYHIPPYSKDFEEAWTNSTNPPFCGWTIVDGGSETPNVINNNDWHKYNTGTRNVARIYYLPVEWSDDWLISPRFNCSAYGTYTLHYWHYYNDYSTSSPDSGNVMLSTDGGASWIRIALYQNADDTGYKSIDITPYVNGNPNVKIGFWYVANDEFYWYIDSFSIDFTPDEEAPTITFIEQPQNTYNNGPYTVRALITDISKPIGASLYHIIDDVITEESPISVSGDTFTFQIPDVSRGTIIEYYIYAYDAAGNDTTSSRYRFFKLSPIGQDTILATAQPDSTVLLEWANPYEVLSYDDGPYYVGSGDTNLYVATQFTPQYSPCKLNGFSVYLYEPTPPLVDSLRFIIWNDLNGIPGTEIFDTTLVPLSYPELTTIDLSGYNIVIPSGDFHIGYQYYNSQKPYFVVDYTSNTFRSKYNDGFGWSYLGYDLCIYAYVEYLPQTKANKNSTVANLPKGELKELVRLERREAKKPVFTPKNIGNYEVLRRDIIGGPWVTIGTPQTNSWIDSTMSNHTYYHYAVRTVYTSPDSVSEISPYREIGIDWTPPQYSNLIIDSVPNYLLPSIEIFDWIWPLLYDSLFYSINDGAFVGVSHDSLTITPPYRFYYTIPLQTKAPVNVKFYFTSADKSEWANTGRDPVSGYYETIVGITEGIPDKLFLKISSLVSGRFNIEFGLPKATNVKISIYNTLGQKITTIDNGRMKAGTYKEDIELKIPSGVYFIRLETGEGKIINKLLKVF